MRTENNPVGWRRAAAVWTALILPAMVAPAQETTLPTLATPTPGYEARLRLDYEYRYRPQGGASNSVSEFDSDLYGYWSGGVRDTAKGWLDLYASGNYRQDLDGSGYRSLATNAFQGAGDARGGTENRLSQLYADLHDPQDRARLRVGRQYLDVVDYLQVDGVQAILFEKERLGGRAFYGLPVSDYSSHPDDQVRGLSLLGRPWEGNVSRLTYANVTSEEGAEDHNFYADVRQQFSESVRARGQASLLNGDFRNGRLDGYYFSPDGETDLSLGVSRWGSYHADSQTYSPYYEVFGEPSAYTYSYARITQLILPHVMLSPGVSAKFVDDPSASNQGYRDYDLTVIYEPLRCLSASVSGDYWDMEDGSRSMGFSGDIRYRHGKAWEFTLGTAYVQYQYDRSYDMTYVDQSGGYLFVSEDGVVERESPFSYTYFLRARWRINRTFTLRAQGDIEDDQDASDLAYRGRISLEARL
jgi:hypothetical protein